MWLPFGRKEKTNIGKGVGASEVPNSLWPGWWLHTCLLYNNSLSFTLNVLCTLLTLHYISTFKSLFKTEKKEKKGCEELRTLTYCQCECTQEQTSYNILEKLKLWKLGDPANSPPSFASGLGTPVHAPPWELFKKP